jgi:hypothetical protein
MRGGRRRRSCDQLLHSERLKDLLEEFALWTALWTGFPLYADLALRKRVVPTPQGHSRESGGKFEER